MYTGFHLESTFVREIPNPTFKWGRVSSEEKEGEKEGGMREREREHERHRETVRAKFIQDPLRCAASSVERNGKVLVWLL